MNSDCPRIKTCINQNCVDPCPGTCGRDARCDVVNHVPMCSCPPGYTGNPFLLCRPHIPGKFTNIYFYDLLILYHFLKLYLKRGNKTRVKFYFFMLGIDYCCS